MKSPATLVIFLLKCCLIFIVCNMLMALAFPTTTPGPFHLDWRTLPGIILLVVFIGYNGRRANRGEDGND